MLSEAIKYLGPVLLGAAGWFITHLLATWRQDAASQSEHRWKLVATYAEFINACSQCADRMYQLKLFHKHWLGHYGAKPKEYEEELRELEENHYLARREVEASWTLLELLHPYTARGGDLRQMLDRYQNASSADAEAIIKQFFDRRIHLVRSVNRDFVQGWKPIGIWEHLKYWCRVRGSKLWNDFKGVFRWNYIRGILRRRTPTEDGSSAQKN